MPNDIAASQRAIDKKKQATVFEQRLGFLASSGLATSLTRLQRGIEKEGLRVTEEGLLAQTPHPAGLGSALTNGWVTTDFSEALLEFITPVRESNQGTLDYLAEAHAVAAQRIDNEAIWAASMPCILPPDDQIPLAQYGSSNIAKMKTVYRRGLGHRYGRAMQTVAGIHYNFSMPNSYWQLERANRELFAPIDPTIEQQDESQTAYIDRRYLDLIRNFRRDYWLLIYLFGAAPCVDKSFVNGRAHNLQSLSNGDLYRPHATSLRMGDLGYQSIAQKSLFICYNELDSYISTLSAAMHTPYPEYEQYGLEVNGEYQQLSCSLLQIENEFYSPIRPKRSTEAGEKPLHALDSRGIQYIEVRCMDINPFLPLGIDEVTSKFIDAFLISCLIKPSVACDEAESQAIAENQSRVVNHGRAPELHLVNGPTETALRALALEKLTVIEAVAKILDSAHGDDGSNSSYFHSVKAQLKKIEDPSLTPSAQL
ncbi:MAG: glutamate--cysteine ligase, partial [Pseudomonadales bacterium]|nr:glutamate--cysteine ligase [Pseudomonadales bacterium]